MQEVENEVLKYHCDAIGVIYWDDVSFNITIRNLKITWHRQCLQN